MSDIKWININRLIIDWAPNLLVALSLWLFNNCNAGQLKIDLQAELLEMVAPPTQKCPPPLQYIIS